MSQCGKLTPNLDQQGTKILNLTVLRRIDPFIEEILFTATHVTFYNFNIASQQWSRKDVEGSLFVVKRNSQPRFQFVVMNRRNTENLVENLLGDFEYDVQKPYLLYRNASQEVNGIWFYNPQECEDVANLFSRILYAYSKVPSKPKVSSSKSEFDELEAVSNIVVIEELLEPPATTSVGTDAPEDSFLANFFSVAPSLGTTIPNVTNSRRSYHPSSIIPLLSHAPSLVSSHAPASHVSSLPFSISHAPTGLQETSDPISSNNPVTNLVKPSSFLAPPSLSSSPLSSSVPSATGLHPPLTFHRQHGTPLLQPFLPTATPPSLTSTSSSTNHGPLIGRDNVQNALLLLVQDDQFIDMFYQALQNVYHL